LSKRSFLFTAVTTVVLLLAVFGVVLSRQRLQRRRLFRATPHPPASAPQKVTAELKPVEQWSAQFRALEVTGRWEQLHVLLGQIATTHPAEFAKWQLGYLDARALIEMDRPRDAATALAPFLAPAHPLRDLALFHRAEIAEAEDDHDAASRFRTTLIISAPQSSMRDQVLDDEVSYRASLSATKPLADLVALLYPKADAKRRRDLDAHLAEKAGDVNSALAVLRGGTMDDAAERAGRALDRPAVLARLNAQQLATLGDTMKNHRRFDRAEAILGRVAHTDALLFDLGRAWFGDEKFAQAQQTYLRGAAATRDPKWKAAFLFHASRAAQLQGDDAGAEKLMNAVLAVPGRTEDHAAALTQQMRTRLKGRRIAAAAADLNAIRAQFPKSHAVVEASLAWSIAMIGMGNNGAALSALNSIPRNLLDKFEPYEVGYWRARALEASNPPAAFAAYLEVLRATQPSHFAYFARARLDAPAMAPKLAGELASREVQALKLMNAGQWEQARRVETDRVLLSSRDHARELARLAAIYRHVPAYAAVLELKPQATPQFPNVSDRPSLLMAMGLFDDATDDIPRRWPLRPLSSALTQSLALNRGNASKESIYAVEVLMNGVPRDYVPDLLPLSVRQLLYPRYFYDFIAGDAKTYHTDPTLLLSIMREESRFNPRAKSEAAARGLLQFIITTARQIGHDVGLVDVSPDDLYDPRVIIRLGAKYVSDLSDKLGGDRYRIAAAYNAGPKQVALWSRLAPAAGDDFFLSSINFDETKQYVRKVMNAYQRYAELYGGAGPQGGVRIEP
jgi:soluble lytic murein transglycosylase-like protein